MTVNDNETKKTPAELNTQRHAFQLTINNPETHGFDHLSIKKTLVENFTTLKYFCLADEIGENGTYHTHLYVCCASRVRFSTMKKNFPEAHIDTAKGTVQQNIDYIKKSGKWADTKKADTRIEGTFEEWGEAPTQKGKRQDMDDLYQLINEGYSDSEILAINHDYILHIDKINKARTTLLIDKYKDKRRLDLKCIYISGATGTNKTRGVLDTHGCSNVYRPADYKHPFDHYECQPVLCLDEFRNSLRISDMLNYCDIYPIQLPARYSNKVACSNWKLEEQYKDIQENDPNSWNAFLRRINEVRIHGKDGSVTIYNSVQEYLNRGNGFHPLPEESGNPFEQEGRHIKGRQMSISDNDTKIL